MRRGVTWSISWRYCSCIDGAKHNLKTRSVSPERRDVVELVVFQHCRGIDVRRP
jgi:hypothetical protein